MDKSTFRLFTMIASLLLLASIIFAGIETKGKLIESRLGILGVVVTAALLLLTAMMMEKKQPPTPPPSPTPEPAVKSGPAPSTDSSSANPQPTTSAVHSHANHEIV